MLRIVRRYFVLRSEGYVPATAWKLALVDCGRSA